MGPVFFCFFYILVTHMRHGKGAMMSEPETREDSRADKLICPARARDNVRTKLHELATKPTPFLRKLAKNEIKKGFYSIPVAIISLVLPPIGLV